MVGAAATSRRGGKKGAPGSTTGFDGTTITVGAISPQTGIASIIGIPLTAGNQVYFDALNAKGGIAGKYKVKLEVRDSAYNSNTAQQNYSDLRDKVAMLAQVLGTDITNALLTPMRQDDMVGAPATLDAQWVRDPNLLPVAGPYQIEAINGLAYWVNEGGGKGKTLCVIRSDDLYGQAGLDGVKYAATKLDFHLGTVAEFPASSTDLTAQLQQVRSGCDAVWLVALPTATIPTMGSAATQALDLRWIGQAPTWVSLLASGATGDYMAKHFWLAAQGPQWGDTSSPGMKQMLDDIAKYKPDQKPDLYFAFGYAQALTVTKLLEKAVELGDLSHAGIKKEGGNWSLIAVSTLMVRRSFRHCTLLAGCSTSRTVKPGAAARMSPAIFCQPRHRSVQRHDPQHRIEIPRVSGRPFETSRCGCERRWR